MPNQDQSKPMLSVPGFLDSLELAFGRRPHGVVLGWLLHSRRPRPHLSVMKYLVLSVCLGASIYAAPVAAQNLPGLGTQPYVMDRLFAAAVGDEIRKACGSISPRLLRVYREAKALERWALDQGYTQDEIDAFLDDRSERQKLEKRRDAYLLASGARKGEPETYCVMGRDEISKGTLIGYLLKAR